MHIYIYIYIHTYISGQIVKPDQLGKNRSGSKWPVKVGHCITDIRPHAAQKVPVRGHSSSFFLISFPDLWLTSPLHVMTWQMRDDVAVVWTSTALRANRYSCTLVWAEWVRAHEGWRKDGFGRELDPQSCTTGKSIPVCGLTELAGNFSICYNFGGLKIPSVIYNTS